jgi:predicted nucleic acid-binding protein
MRTPRIYLDTSVIGGYFDPEFAKWTKRLFAALEAGRFVAVLSPVVVRELQAAPERVQNLVKKASAIRWEYAAVSADIDQLADLYLRAGVVGKALRDDCLHVATATVWDADVLVSWNFRHIVRYDRIRGFNAVNLREGYRPIDIRSPMEVTEDDD